MGSILEIINEEIENHNFNQLIGSDEFKNWFGDWENDPENSSKVVDVDGKPLVVYHATNNNFNQFRPSTMLNNGSVKYKGIDIPDSEWNDFISSHDLEQQDEFWFSTKPWGNDDNDIILPVFLNIRNLEIGDAGDVGGYGTYHNYISTYDSSDGLVIHNADNSGMDYYITTTPENIKIANGKNKIFSPTNTDIYK